MFVNAQTFLNGRAILTVRQEIHEQAFADHKNVRANMFAEWIHSSNGLPREGQQIEFLLECRSVAMEGSYTHHAFRSHWAEYAVDRVHSWRNLREGSDLATSARNEASSVLSSAQRLDSIHLPLNLGGLAHAT